MTFNVTPKTAIWELDVNSTGKKQSDELFFLINNSLRNPLRDSAGMMGISCKFANLTIEEFSKEEVLPEKQETLIHEIQKLMERPN